MTICSTCKKEVNDIRPQIEGVGVCFDCADKPMTKEAMEKWEKVHKKKIINEFNHFCKCINFKLSALDARAIRFMNEFESYLK